MNISTLIFSEGKSLNRIFKVSALLIPRFGTNPQEAMKFSNDSEAQKLLNTLPLNIKETCSLQHFRFN